MAGPVIEPGKRRRDRRCWLAWLLIASAVPCGARERGIASRWFTGWASAQQMPDARNGLPADPSGTATLRQVVRVTLGGSRLRLRLSNVFGTAPLAVDGVHVARSAGAGSAATVSGSDREVLFAGSATVVIPAGADYWSDPVSLPLAARDSLAVSMRLTVPTDHQTVHVASHATSFIVQGDRLSAHDMPDAQRVERWGFLSGVDVAGTGLRGTVVALGDSITDGSWSTTDGNDRWPDILADRLAGSAATRGLGVANLGIGGNRLLLDGNGPSALSRFDRDVLAQSGVSFVILTEGINDIGTLTHSGPVGPAQHAALVTNIIGAYRQITIRAHQHGIAVLCGTLPPFTGAKSYQPNAANEGDRVAVNRWITQSDLCDAVLDFDAMLRDPVHPDRLKPVYDSGDHLHPSPAGYRRMAEGIPLPLFKSKPRAGKLRTITADKH